MTTTYTLIFQAAKLGDLGPILDEMRRAQVLLDANVSARRVYGLSGGALTALAFSLGRAARMEPERWSRAAGALDEFSIFLAEARSRDLRSRCLNPKHGIFRLAPLRKWLAGRLRAYLGREDVLISEIPGRLYLCAGDRDGTLTLFGRPDPDLAFQYQWVRVGPPQDAPVLDALQAALSTVLSTAPVQVNGEWYRDARPAISDAGALVTDLEASDPAPVLRTRPYTPLRTWKLNWITSSFIMHSQNERNQSLLAAYYMDLVERNRELDEMAAGLGVYQPEMGLRENRGVRPDAPTGEMRDSGGSGDQRREGQASEQPGVRTEAPTGEGQRRPAPALRHLDLPYVGSTEAFTNMRESVERKAELVKKFTRLLDGQAEGFPFDQPANIIYGAGGFSGILGGLTATRLVDAGFAAGGGEVRQVYGVSAGVLNGFFHAVQIAAAQHTDLYRPEARRALADLEAFIADVTPGKIGRINRDPRRLWQGWGNLGPLEAFLKERLAAYTGSDQPETLTFDDIALPLTIAAARGDGFTDFLGMTQPRRHMHFSGREIEVRSAPVIRAILAGWSMNTYVQPTALNGQMYRDGGGTFYDIGLFAACLDEHLTNLINIHLDEPEDHTYHIPPRPHLVRILFDTHNYYFPEERRRMRFLTDLLYRHFALRERLAAARPEVTLPPDFRQSWELPERQDGGQAAAAARAA